MYKGIDVSENQGAIDWSKAKRAGCEFAILRSIRHSGKVDNRFVENLKGCRLYDIPVGVYKYTYAKNVDEAKAEASQVVNLLKENNLKCKVFWDVEDRDYLYGLGKEKLTEVIQAAQAVVEDAGLKFCIYTGLYVYKERWFDFSRFSCPLWVARYPLSGTKTLSDTPAEKYKPDLGREIYGWQYSSEGKVDGISTNVDLNILYSNPASLESGLVQSSTSADVFSDQYIVVTEKIDMKQAQQLSGIIIDNFGIGSEIYKMV